MKAIDISNLIDQHTPGMKVPTRPTRVRFVSKANRVCLVESFIEDRAVIPSLWYQPAELMSVKTQLKDAAREWRKTGLGILLNDTFNNENEELNQKCLNAFAQLSDNEYNRGIERYLSRQHDQERVYKKRDHVQDVLAQERYLSTLSKLTKEEKRIKLAEFSANQSKCAEVFAQRLGKADEVAVMEGEDPSAAARLVSEMYRHQKAQRRNSAGHIPSKEPYKEATKDSAASFVRRFKMQRRLSC